MPFAYPVALELGGLRCVVIGATAVREGKVEGLLAGGAGEVLVLAERPADRLRALEALDRRVRVERRAWRPSDLDGAFVCIASSDDPAERDAIASAARERGVLVNVMDDVANCDWAAPAVVRRGELVLTVSTGGASPALARKLRERLGEAFGPEWAEVLTVLREVREETMPVLPDLPERSRRWAAALDPDEAAALVRAGDAAGLHERLRDRILEVTADASGGRRPADAAPSEGSAAGDLGVLPLSPRGPGTRTRAGTVTLVGAGPGDPELITVAGARALAEADVVVYDRLVDPRLLGLAPAQAERIYVGKEPGRSATPQEAIDALLVARARDGDHVVRLKGGDPFVFGRGGEELLACAAAGVPCTVVPGITSAIAAPAAAGIPVTHRGVARSFAVVTGSSAHGDGVDLASVATASDTLIVLMAAGSLAERCAELIAAGRPADEPAAIVQWATTPEERTVTGTLADLPIRALRARIGPPATLIVGQVCDLATAAPIAWSPRETNA
jgi:uroporphyrin-III C-methyltransferase/precorrin-2 dehydrogenase/sirohydrochlorin ferrochelatase